MPIPHILLRPFFAVVAATVLAASPIAAQRNSEVQPGSRVRLTMPLLGNIGVQDTRVQRPAIGTLLAVDSVSLTARMEQDGTEMTIPFSVIRRLQVSRGSVTIAEGRRNGLRKGVLIGGGAALIFAAAVYGIDAATETLAEERCRREELVCEASSYLDLTDEARAIGVGTPGGALVGLAVGGRESERWEEVRPRTLRPSAAPREVALSISLAF